MNDAHLAHLAHLAHSFQASFERKYIRQNGEQNTDAAARAVFLLSEEIIAVVGEYGVRVPLVRFFNFFLAKFP